jgi:3-oxoacyl-[acyl-carrier protein] reductase
VGKLDDKVALITGSRRGIGKAIALSFAKEGANIIVADVVFEGSEKEDAIREIEALGAQAIAVQCDVGVRSQVEKAVQSSIERFGRIDILVNNAGISLDAVILKMTDEMWNEVMRVDLYGPFVVTQEVAKHMIEAKYGKIVNISSAAAVKGVYGGSNYTAAKAGLLGFTKCAAREFSRHNITVNAICPGATLTWNVEKLNDKIKQVMRDQTLLSRFAEPEEIAKVALFFASEDSSFITGQVLVADGGRCDKL